MYAKAVAGTRYQFADLRTLLAKASPLRSGDVLAGLAAADATERVAAQMTLADMPLKVFLSEAVVPYEKDHRFAHEAFGVETIRDIVVDDVAVARAGAALEVAAGEIEHPPPPSYRRPCAW